MIWEDECYLLSKRKFRENANIINIFSKKNAQQNAAAKLLKILNV